MAATAPNFFIKKEYLQQHHTDLSDRSLSSLAETKSENTIDAYASDWTDFCDWCRIHHECAFPAKAASIINYINDLAVYAKTSTIRRRISALSENFNAAGLSNTNPCREWIVREALVGLGRAKGSVQKGKTPIYWEELEQMIQSMDMNDLVDVRDKAILLLGFMGAFRRSEIAGLKAEDVTFRPQGMIITITHSKTDQASEGQHVGIPYIENTNMCAATAVSEWLKRTGIKEGPLFRRVWKDTVKKKSEKKETTASAERKFSDAGISDKTVNLIVKKYVERIGLDVDFYGAHSLRHGFATFAALNRVEERIIMKQTRHRSVEMVRHYINEADLFVNNPISLIFDKK